jgi:hypothetical protein
MRKRCMTILERYENWLEGSLAEEWTDKDWYLLLKDPQTPANVHEGLKEVLSAERERTDGSPCVPRPYLKPFFIVSVCNECDRPLELRDLHDDEGTLAHEEHEGDVWWDEWCCPNCKDGIIHDWPPAAIAHLRELHEQAKKDAGEGLAWLLKVGEEGPYLQHQTTGEVKSLEEAASGQ